MFARRTIYSFQRTTEVSCYKYLHWRGKTKVSYYILLREKQKYRITSHSLLRPFSCGLCYSDGGIILSSCQKRKVNYYVCKKNNIFLSTNNGSVMLEIFHCRGKTKVSYYILLREKQKYHFTSRSYKLS